MTMKMNSAEAPLYDAFSKFLMLDHQVDRILPSAVGTFADAIATRISGYGADYRPTDGYVQIYYTLKECYINFVRDWLVNVNSIDIMDLTYAMIEKLPDTYKSAMSIIGIKPEELKVD